MNCSSKWLSTICRVLAAVLFIVYISYLIYLTFFSHLYGRGFTHRSISLVPFRTILEYAASSYNQNIIFINLFGNILAFVPLGFLLPLIWHNLSRMIKIILIATCASLGIEVFQFIFGVGSTDIDDVILNAAGGILGYGLYRIVVIVVSTKRWLPFRRE